MTDIATLKGAVEKAFEEAELYFQDDKEQKYTQIGKDFISQAEALKSTDEYTINYIKAYSLSLVSHYSAEAERLLQLNVSADSGNEESQILLGLVLCRKKDFVGSKKAFNTVLEKSNRKNKKALRYLSTVMRFGGVTEHMDKVIEESVKIAKEALLLDMKDPESWYVVGNAMLSSYFASQKPVDELRYALKCYTNAETYYGTVKNPDLFFNRGNILKYLQDYNGAVVAYQQADRLDSSLNASHLISDISKRFSDVSALIKNHGNFTEKNIYNNIVTTIPATLSAKNKVLSEKYAIFPLCSLHEGVNQNAVLTGRVTHIISAKGEIPAQFVACDMQGQFFCLAVYNISEDIYKQVQKYSDIFLADPCLSITHSIKSTKNEQLGSSYKTIQIFEVNKFMVDYNKVTDAYSPTLVVSEQLQK